MNISPVRNNFVKCKQLSFQKLRQDAADYLSFRTLNLDIKDANEVLEGIIDIAKRAKDSSVLDIGIEEYYGKDDIGNESIQKRLCFYNALTNEKVSNLQFDELATWYSREKDGKIYANVKQNENCDYLSNGYKIKRHNILQSSVQIPFDEYKNSIIEQFNQTEQKVVNDLIK